MTVYVPHNTDNLKNWIKYKPSLCKQCMATCCSLPVEIDGSDLVRMELIDAFELEEPAKKIAKRLFKEGVIEHFHAKTGVYTLTRLANGDCLYLDQHNRRCTIYNKRPETCRNHPQVGPRPGYCAFRVKAES